MVSACHAPLLSAHYLVHELDLFAQCKVGFAIQSGRSVFSRTLKTHGPTRCCIEHCIGGKTAVLQFSMSAILHAEGRFFSSCARPAHVCAERLRHVHVTYWRRGSEWISRVACRVHKGGQEDIDGMWPRAVGFTT